MILVLLSDVFSGQIEGSFYVCKFTIPYRRERIAEASG